jgi:hypothetical protein
MHVHHVVFLPPKRRSTLPWLRPDRNVRDSACAHAQDTRQGAESLMIDAQTQERIRVFVPYPTLHGGALEPYVGFAVVQT